MDPLMHLGTVRMSKNFDTILTRIWFFTSMDPLMHLGFVRCSKFF
jgi:hypothetical protein